MEKTYCSEDAGLRGNVQRADGSYVGKNALLSGNVSVGEGVFIAANTVLTGDVTLGKDSAVWFNTVIRGDEAKVIIGDRTNVQDNCTLHVNEHYPLSIGNDVTIGHNAIVHGCTVGDGTLIGMGAVILNGAKIGSHCLIGAGALVTENAEIPDGSLVIGMPGKVKRELTEEEQAGVLKNAEVYVEEAKKYKEKGWA